MDLEKLLDQIYNSKPLNSDELHRHLKLIKPYKFFIYNSNRHPNCDPTKINEIIYSIQAHSVVKEYMIHDKVKNTIIITREPDYYMVYYLDPNHKSNHQAS
jgi:hypothetical protein